MDTCLLEWNLVKYKDNFTLEFILINIREKGRKIC